VKNVIDRLPQAYNRSTGARPLRTGVAPPTRTPWPPTLEIISRGLGVRVSRRRVIRAATRCSRPSRDEGTSLGNLCRVVVTAGSPASWNSPPLSPLKTRDRPRSPSCSRVRPLVPRCGGSCAKCVARPPTAVQRVVAVLDGHLSSERSPRLIGSTVEAPPGLSLSDQPSAHHPGHSPVVHKLPFQPVLSRSLTTAARIETTPSKASPAAEARKTAQLTKPQIARCTPSVLGCERGEAT